MSNLVEPNSPSSENPSSTFDNAPPITWIKHTIVTTVIIAITLMTIGAMFANKPEARKFGGRPQPSVGVETTQLTPTDFPVWIDSYGVAEPLTRTQLVSDITARVIEVSPLIRPGATFQKGDILVQLEPKDFEIEVNIAKATVADAKVRYKQEVAQAELAKKDWNVRPGNLEARSLALREPQVAAALATLEAALARLERAQLNLQRTTIKAPFDGKVLTQSVDLGQVVNPSQPIAEIYSTDAIEVRLPIKAIDLDYVNVPSEQPNDALIRPKVIVEAELGRKTYQWEGELVRSEGAFDTDTRLLYVVARINDPFRAKLNRPAMRAGQFVRAKIEGEVLRDVYVIPRRAVTQNNQIAIIEEGLLKKRFIDPLWTDKEIVVIQSNNDNTALTQSDQLILTPTANLVDGTRVKSLSSKARLSTKPTNDNAGSKTQTRAASTTNGSAAATQTAN